MEVLYILLALLYSTKSSDGVTVLQKRPEIIMSVGKETETLHCEHDDADYYYMFCVNYDPAYFGSGTKLTVLDSKVTPPKVKVLPPSSQENCDERRSRDKTPKVTLLCVVTGFYPDHISVSWQLNRRDISRGVRTDDVATRDADDRFYSITSRLRVRSNKWFNTRNFFTCTTSFFDGNHTLENADSISGAKGGGLDRDYNLKAGQTAKLSYSLFLAKSFLYGLFISFVVWKIRSSAGKRYD
ncbi:hypothetical protein COCON_G00017780 [Conger conger]|uniref:Ig-like domain-containing protein n=1 Tax=Conger conger TaxID=82655 RepID=A0A9Q1E4D9_CONCO|nr:hypothetical protein COCON_G00017780 [Conger conger]